MRSFVRLVSIVSMLVVLSTSIVPKSVRADEATVDAEAQKQVHLPWMASRTCDKRVRPSLFGVQMYGRTDRGSKFFPSLQNSGATWVRVPIPWNLVEPANTAAANFRWHVSDAIVAAAQDGCVNIIATHRSNPGWAATDEQGPVYWQNLDDLAGYMRAMVERYDGDGFKDAPGSPVVRYWELYNEPDINSASTGWGQYTTRYAAMLQHVYPAMKAAHPSTQVLLGGLAYELLDDKNVPFNPSFVIDVVNAGGGDYFDMTNFHYFPVFATNWTEQGPGLIEKTAAFRRDMRKAGIDKPIVITEAGHLANTNSAGLGSPELQLRYVVEMYTQAKASNIRVLVWFSLADVRDASNKMGLVTRANPPYERPAYAAYLFASQELRDAEYKRRLSRQETGSELMEVHKLRDESRKVDIYVAWMNPVRTNSQNPLSLKASNVTVRDVFGNETTVRDNDDGKADGRVTVNVGGRPVYIEKS